MSTDRIIHRDLKVCVLTWNRLRMLSMTIE